MIYGGAEGMWDDENYEFYSGPGYTTTEMEFEYGSAYTNNMITLYRHYDYMDSFPDNIWDKIQVVFNNTFGKDILDSGWFVPSKCEWLAFADAFGITKETFEDYSLSPYYWSSSAHGSQNKAWNIGFGMNEMQLTEFWNVWNIRLSTIF